MWDLGAFLNNRELAAFFWLSAGLVWALTHRGVRIAVLNFLRSLLGQKVLTAVLLMLVYVAAVLLMLAALRFWTVGLAKETAFWTAGVALVLLFNSTQALKDDRFFRKTIVDNAKLAVVLEFLTNLYVFPLWLELVVFPFFLLLVIMQAIAETDPRYSLVQKALAWPLAVYGFSVLGFSVYSAVIDFASFLTWDVLRRFLLPFVLTVALLPFIYFFALYMQYEATFVRLGFFNDDVQVVRLVKWALIRRFKCRLFALNRWVRSGQVVKVASVRGKRDLQTLFVTEPNSK